MVEYNARNTIKQGYKGLGKILVIEIISWIILVTIEQSPVIPSIIVDKTEPIKLKKSIKILLIIILYNNCRKK